LGVWIQGLRYDTIHTHGTGCTLSSTIASAFAIGYQQRELSMNTNGANAAIHDLDAFVLSKAYISAGIFNGVQLGKIPGPVAQTGFPSSPDFFPTIVTTATTKPPRPFLPMQSFQSKTQSADNNNKPQLGLILPIVNTVEWVERLATIDGITDIQLRIKNESNPQTIHNMV